MDTEWIQNDGKEMGMNELPALLLGLLVPADEAALLADWQIVLTAGDSE